MDVFLEAVLPDESLYIFGAGHISGSTAAFAKSLGFRVVVIDPRVEYNNPDRFPDADELIVEEYGEAFTKLQVDDQSYIVIVTRGHALDELCLEFAVGTRAKYIGMIGSKKKIREGNQRLLENGVSQKQLDRIHAPVGLEIGAETPEEIAISIMAQVIQTRRTAAD
jgi:xanthine dehydrogenase accessory factor